MAPKKKCSCCECTKKKKEKDCSQYPAGIQKEDLLWAYFVMRMVLQMCEVLGDPDLLKRIQDRQATGPTTMFDLAMMCCASKNPEAFKAAAEAAKAENAAMEAKKKEEEEEKKRRREEAKQQQQQQQQP
ncbi:uncharacterized protein isoform X3 [Rhodnius prolixus]|uniref:uncharacterized protein isoform X3 n=1 Tax=Rhodnius prolixus TaxID=13249 RepID=UPI003D18A473